MSNNQGFISIISLLAMAIILISALFLIYTSNLEYLILNSSKNSIQASYLAESKIYMILNKEEYYYAQLLPRIERYLIYEKLGNSSDYKIYVNNEDLIEKDKNNKIDISFLLEDGNRRFMELETYSTYNGIKKNVAAKMTLINEFFDMGLPILSIDNIDEERIKDYESYFKYLKETITLPEIKKDIIGFEAVDYDDIKIIKDIDGKMNIKFFRNNIEKPIKEQLLSSNKIILIAKKINSNPTRLSIFTEKDLDKIVLNGAIYVEGDIFIHDNIEFKGVLILNDGRLFIDSSSEAKIEGIILMKDYPKIIENKENISINFNREEIRKYGVYLPKFIDPKIRSIKIN